MPVNGLMLTLTDDSRSAPALLARLDGRREIEVGVLEERWMSVVVDAANQDEARELHRWLESLEEIEQVEVVCVTFSEESNSNSNSNSNSEIDE